MPDVQVDTRDKVRVITLDRPERHNAVYDEMTDSINEAFAQAATDSAVSVILVRGNGPSFCSGRDTSVLGQRPEGEGDFSFIRRRQADRARSVWDNPKPIIAEVKGAVLGGGCQLALSADIRISSTDLSMGLPEITHGLVTDLGGAQQMRSLIGPSRTKYLLFTGERLDAQTAVQWGAVDFVVAPEDLEERAFAMARTIASRSPMAVAIAKQLVNRIDRGAMRDGVEHELLGQSLLFMSEDYQEGKLARSQQREPNYRGR